MTTQAHLLCIDRPCRQRGVYALEWAIIFPVFFVLLYAIVSYGLTFFVRESMQFAVEEGARAALRYPVGVNAPNWLHRKQAAIASVQKMLAWLPDDLKPAVADIQFTVCHLSDTTCFQNSPLNNNLACDIGTPCLILISYRIENYPSKAIAPSIAGIKIILPNSLTASAALLADRRML